MLKPTTCLLTAAVAASLLVASSPAVAPAVAAPSTPAERTVTTPALSSAAAWKRCADPLLDAYGAECARLRVPLRHSRPNGKKISIAVSRVRATAPADQRLGAMLVNPGGPGGPGLQYSTLGDLLPGGVGERYDWVGFDPRGIGASRPALRCDRDYNGYARPDHRTKTKRSERVWRKRSQAYARSCADTKRERQLLRNIRTTDVARDMDLIRAALGEQKISFYGFSYGTYLGQVYATMFPSRVTRMVMDANVDPGKVWYRANLAQTKAFNRNINTWFAWVAKHDDFYDLGRTKKKVRRAWYAERRALKRSPAGGRIGPSEWTDTFLYAAYYESTWLDLADAWYAWSKDGDWRGLRDQYASFNAPRDDNGYAVYLAVSCTDAPWPKRWKKWRRDARRLDRASPFLAWGNTWFNAPCADWRVKPGKRFKVRGNDTDMLLVNETRDAATPYSGAIEVRKRFRRSSLVAVPKGITHAGSLTQNRCVDLAVADYLATGKRPERLSGDRADLRCPRTKQPDPDGGLFGGVRGRGTSPLDVVRRGLLPR